MSGAVRVRAVRGRIRRPNEKPFLNFDSPDSDSELGRQGGPSDVPQDPTAQVQGPNCGPAGER